MNKPLLKVSLIGTAIIAICGFTPILGSLLSFMGLSALIGWLDGVLLPTLVFFVGLTVYALVSNNKRIG